MKIKFIIVYLFIVSCNENIADDHKKFTVSDFSEKRVDTLIPYEYKSYHSYYIKIKGNVNDSVRIQRDGYYHYIILPGKVDTLLNGDYYGTEKIIWTFDPYRASKGKLEIEYSL